MNPDVVILDVVNKMGMYNTDLANTILKLAKYKGKIEISFKESDNPNFDRICLVFIKMPIHDSIINVLSRVIAKDKNSSLAKGKLDINKYDTYNELIGIIRIKQINRISIVIYSMINRMRNIIHTAYKLKKRDDIGNRIFPAMNTGNDYAK